MKVLKRRSRTIGIRVSEEELLTFQQACLSTGARSVSDLARNAIKEFVNRMDGKKVAAMNKTEHSAHLKHLEQRVAELAEELSQFKARSPLNETED